MTMFVSFQPFFVIYYNDVLQIRCMMLRLAVTVTTRIMFLVGDANANLNLHLPLFTGRGLRIQIFLKLVPQNDFIDVPDSSPLRHGAKPEYHQPQQ